MIQQRLIANMYLVLFQKRRHWNNNGEFFRITFIIIGHPENGLVFVADQDDLRSLIVELGIRLGHIEPAKGIGESWERQDAGQNDHSDWDLELLWSLDVGAWSFSTQVLVHRFLLSWSRI